MSTLLECCTTITPLYLLEDKEHSIMNGRNVSTVRGLNSAVAERSNIKATNSPISFTQQFVPWRDGKDITGTDTWGFKWYEYPLDFSGMNNNGKYFISNGCDAYLFIGDQPISVQQLSTYNLNVVPPMTAGIFDIGSDNFTLTCVCAGYDFTTTRINPGRNSPIQNVRGNFAHVKVSSLGGKIDPSSQPPIRSGWTRVYDWYDFTASPHSPISVIHNSFFNTYPCDITGATGVIAMASINNPSGVSFSVILYSFGPVYSSTFYALGSNTYTSAGNVNAVISATSLVGYGPFIQILNNDAVNPITINDLNMEIAF